MGYDTGLADRIRRKGVRVIEVAGWQTRGSVTFGPVGSVNHHTAGGARGATPSMNVVIYGRPDVPGPLAQVLQSREPDGNDIAYMIAAGRANHAGRGGWRGLSGNSSVHGLEIEHTGFGSVPAQRLEIAARIQAAFLEGSSHNASLCCQHFEWAPDRKVDFRELHPPFNAHTFRDRVAYWIGRNAEEEDDMPYSPEEIRRFAKGGVIDALVERGEHRGAIQWLNEEAMLSERGQMAGGRFVLEALKHPEGQAALVKMLNSVEGQKALEAAVRAVLAEGTEA